MTRKSARLSARALAEFRFAVISEVRTRVLRGETRASAVRDVAKLDHYGPDGRPWRVSARTVYRWFVFASEGRGVDALVPKPRTRTEASVVLDPAVLTFIHTEKLADPRASVPELIRRGVVAGLLTSSNDVDRTTVWRALRRLGAPTRTGIKVNPDQRRFAKESRMQIVLCDGKHFLAGKHRARRVALFFLDDATRFVIHVVVGTSETAVLFLRGFFGVLQRVGRMDIVYFDNGSGFSADASHAVISGLDIGHVHGTAGYPPGRGKIERFNQTAQEAILRHLTRDDVDPDCTSLELRLAHYLTEVYNTQPHSSLHGMSPQEAFLRDDRPLHPYPDADALRQKFFVDEERLVSNDHIISVDSVWYEVPRGLAGERITVARDVFDHSHLRLDHDGRSIRLREVDLQANARTRRSGARPAAPEPEPTTGSAATRAADLALAPITQPDGGFADVDPDQEPPSWT